jgi:hypothetical protein
MVCPVLKSVYGVQLSINSEKIAVYIAIAII